MFILSEHNAVMLVARIRRTNSNTQDTSDSGKSPNNWAGDNGDPCVNLPFVLCPTDRLQSLVGFSWVGCNDLDTPFRIVEFVFE